MGNVFCCEPVGLLEHSLEHTAHSQAVGCPLTGWPINSHYLGTPVEAWGR